jgi:hypothetical protein
MATHLSLSLFQPRRAYLTQILRLRSQKCHRTARVEVEVEVNGGPRNGQGESDPQRRYVQGGCPWDQTGFLYVSDDVHVMVNLTGRRTPIISSRPMKSLQVWQRKMRSRIAGTAVILVASMICAMELVVALLLPQTRSISTNVPTIGPV